MSVRAAEGPVFPGWWQRFGTFVLTVAATEPFAPPRPLVDPPGLATAVPAHTWLSEQGLSAGAWTGAVSDEP